MTVEEVYKQYKRMITDIVMKRIGDASEWKDVEQFIWLSVVSSYPTYDAEKSAMSTWLYILAENKCKDYHRNHVERQPTLVMESTLTGTNEDGDEEAWLELQSGYPSDNPENEAIRDEELMLKYVAMSDRERAAFNLVYWHGYSHQGAANKMRLGVSTVGTLVERTKRKFEPVRLFYGDKVFLYRSAGNVWCDWSFMPKGLGNLRMEEGYSGK